MKSTKQINNWLGVNGAYLYDSRLLSNPKIMRCEVRPGILVLRGVYGHFFVFGKGMSLTHCSTGDVMFYD